MLLPLANALESVDAAMTARLSASAFREIVDLVPDAWLDADPAFVSAGKRASRRTSIT